MKKISKKLYGEICALNSTLTCLEVELSELDDQVSAQIINLVNAATTGSGKSYLSVLLEIEKAKEQLSKLVQPIPSTAITYRGQRTYAWQESYKGEAYDTWAEEWEEYAIEMGESDNCVTLCTNIYLLGSAPEVEVYRTNENEYIVPADAP